VRGLSLGVCVCACVCVRACVWEGGGEDERAGGGEVQSAREMAIGPQVCVRECVWERAKEMERCGGREAGCAPA